MKRYCWVAEFPTIPAPTLAHYTANRCQDRYEEVLDGIVQGENETLRHYIDRFNEEAETIRDLEVKDKLKCMKRGLRPDSLFAQEVELNRYQDLTVFLRREIDHMAYE